MRYYEDNSVSDDNESDEEEDGDEDDSDVLNGQVLQKDTASPKSLKNLLKIKS